MSGIKGKIRRLRFKLNHDFLTLEHVILILAVVLCLFWSFQSIMAMSRSWNLSEKLAAERRTQELLEIEIEAVMFENEYYMSSEYQELSARKLLDKKLEGENMVVLLPNSEKAKNKYEHSVTKPEEEKNSNFRKWMMYLFPKF